MNTTQLQTSPPSLHEAPTRVFDSQMAALCVENACFRLTDGGDDEHDEEGVEHRHHRARERRDDVPERAQAAEEPDHPEGPQGAALLNKNKI
jgi:hypothetical protein